MLLERKHVPSRAAFTLVELLAVIVIIGILSSIMLTALASAAETAREARTRSQILRIHELLSTRWESYRTRRVEAADPVKFTTVRGRMGNRVDKIRELMRMEVPSTRDDLFDDKKVLSATPALHRRYKRMIVKFTGGVGPNLDAQWNDVVNNDKWTKYNDSAECLYLILASIQDGDANGLEFLRDNEIGDLDGDGVPEVLDGWGRPLYFARWPVGYTEASSVLNDEYAPDPFDPLGVRNGLAKTGDKYNHFAIFPLIMSAGGDQQINRVFDFENGTDYANTSPARNNPYIEGNHPDVDDPVLQPLKVRVGGIWDTREAGHFDNISNHQLVVGGG
ncbi:MAG: hypothetical protein COA78_18885 [Blastopirellula sp.]|nr:MAG: hypothetical protein COA78_18885 [Blastopirellula sp.]